MLWLSTTSPMEIFMIRNLRVPLCLILLILTGCTKQLCVNMKLASTSSNIQMTEDFSKETKVEQITTWYVMGIPVGDVTSPQSTFNRLNQDAVYINNLELRSSFWYLSIPISETFSLGIEKQSWNAKGTVVKRTN